MSSAWPRSEGDLWRGTGGPPTCLTSRLGHLDYRGVKSGDVIADRFVVERFVGAGGMGAVYRALDRRSGSTIALKVLTASSHDAAERFKREARVLAELVHPGIVKYVASGEEDAFGFLAMEWLEGEDLAMRLERSALTVRESILLVRRVADALAFAHAHGVLHRDVKPANVFLPAYEPADAKVLDFGIARDLRVAHAVTKTGLVVGTLGYLAPEQARGERQVSSQIDVFALGCVLLECLTGRPAFEGNNPVVILSKILVEASPRLSDRRPDLPEGLAELVRRMLCKDPNERPADAGAVRDALAQFSELEGPAPAPSAPARAPMDAPLPLVATKELQFVTVVMAGPEGGGCAESVELVDSSATFADKASVLRVAGRSGATCEVLLDGSLLFVFAGPMMATDRAAAAARTALAVRHAYPARTVIIASGRAEVGGRLPVGEALDRAGGLLLRATPGAPVKIDEVTAGLLDARFELVRPAASKGVSVEDGSQSLILKGEFESDEGARTLLGRRTSFVGRDREVSVILGIFDECVSEPVARAALVTAAAGMGKSRLRYELVRQLAQRERSYTLLFGRGDFQRAGSPYALVAPAIRSAASILAEESEDIQRDKLRGYVASRVPSADQGRVTDFLGEMVGVHFSDEDSVQLRSARRDAMLMADQTRRAFEDFLAAELARQPVLVVLEDLHWGDIPSVLCIDGAMRRLADKPLMVLAFARPEVTDIFPDLWREHAVQPVPLPALGRRAATQLVHEVLDSSLTTEAVERIVDRASGNVFYLEELIRAIADGKGAGLPDTVLAMVQARLAMLDSDLRRVLRTASLFGQTFWKGGLGAILRSHAEVGSQLEMLAEREFVSPGSGTRFPGEREFRFRHALVREAAYAMLTETDRIRGHALVADWLEARGERDAALLADHFDRGGDRARAAESYTRAAEQALEANDLDGVIGHARSAISCGANAELLGRLKLALSIAHRWRGKWAETEVCAAEAISLLPMGSRRWFVAAEQRIFGLGKAGRYEELESIVEAVSTVTPEEDARGAYAVALGRGSWFLVHACRFEHARAVLSQLEGTAGLETDLGAAAQLDAIRAGHALYAEDWESCVALSQSAIQRFEMAGDPRGSAMQLVFVADAYKELGAYDRAEPIFREAIATASRMGLGVVTSLAKMNLSLVLAYSGSIASAVTIGHEALQEYAMHGDHRLLVCAKSYLAKILAMSRDQEGAERMAKEATETACHSPPTRAYAQATLARVLLSGGKASEALTAARLAMDTLLELGRLEEGDSLTRLVYAEALHASGDESEARQAISAAREHVLRRAATLRDPAIREGFLKRVPYNAETLARAAEWIGGP
jgi:tetratricopeptide (TPR) repeat protein